MGYFLCVVCVRLVPAAPLKLWNKMGRHGMICFLVIAKHTRIFRRRMLKNCEIAFIRPGRWGGEEMENDTMGPGSDSACLNLSHLSGALRGLFNTKCVKPC